MRNTWLIMGLDMPGTRAIYVGFQGHRKTKTIQLLGESGGKLFRLAANSVAVCHAVQRRKEEREGKSKCVRGGERGGG